LHVSEVLPTLYHGPGKGIVPVMNDPCNDYERIRNLWAPWRAEYIQSLSDDDDSCFLCRCRDQIDRDRENLVVWRRPHCIAVMNRFPYTGGHMLVAPLEHVPDLASMDGVTMQEMMAMLSDLQKALGKALGAQGFNIGINVGRCAGAGLPGHLHAHIVPRWPGDTNFMSVFDDIRVVPMALEGIYDAIRQAGRDMGIEAEPGE